MVEKERLKEVKNAQASDYSRVQPGQRVYCQDGYAGKIVSLRRIPEREYEALVLQTGRVFRRKYIVPFTWISRIESDRVYLSAKKEDLTALPEKRHDSTLVIEIQRALRAERILHGAAIENIHVTARRGFIRLDGYVPDSGDKSRAEEATRQVPGVLGVESRLVVDEDLKLAAAQAVTQIPESSAGRIFVGAQNGYIMLTGEVPSAESRLAAEERAGIVPGIRGVLNSIRVEGLEYSEPRAFQPRIGARVYGRNVVSAHVEQVIVNRINRLVDAIVVDGLCPEPRKEKTHWFLGDTALMRRKVVIPVHNIQHQTRTAVFLENEVPRFEDFDSRSLASPEGDWTPPYPYRRKDVLLPSN